MEAAWQYRLPARVTPTIRARQAGLPKAITDIAWKAQTRLCERYRALIRKHKKPVVAIAAVGRELAGFVWAIARRVDGKPVPEPESVPAAGPRTPSPNSQLGDGRGVAAEGTVPEAKRTFRLNPRKTYVARKPGAPTPK